MGLEIEVETMDSLFTRFVEPGRLVRVTYGEDIDKIAVIVDICNTRRVVIDGPTTNCPRQLITVRRIQLLPQKIDIPRRILSDALKAAMTKDSGIVNEAQNERCVKLRTGRVALQKMTDFERFKYELAVKKLKAKRVELAGL